MEVKFRHTHLRKTFFYFHGASLHLITECKIISLPTQCTKPFQWCEAFLWLFFVTDVFNGQKMFQKVCNMPTLYLKEKLLRIASHNVVHFIQKGAKYNMSYCWFINIALYRLRFPYLDMNCFY